MKQVLRIYFVILIALSQLSSAESKLLEWANYTKTVNDTLGLVLTEGTLQQLNTAAAERFLSSYKEAYKMSILKMNEALISNDLQNIQKLRTLRDEAYDIYKSKEAANLKFQALDAKFVDYADTGFKALSIVLDAYSIGQYAGKIVNKDGSLVENSGLLSTTAYSLVQSSSELMFKIFPASSSKFVKVGEWFATKAPLLKKFGTFTTVLQLNAIAYTYFRDKGVEESRNAYLSWYKTYLAHRERIIGRLRTLYSNRLEDTPVSLRDITEILDTYLVFRDSSFIEPVTLTQTFLNYTNNASYLQEEFGTTDFNALKNYEKIKVALDALAILSALEDASFVTELDKTINKVPFDERTLSGILASGEDFVAAAFSGSEAYKIYDNEDFKRKQIPSEFTVGTSVTRSEYYSWYYFSIFMQDLAIEVLEKSREIGKIYTDLQAEHEKYAEENQKALLFWRVPKTVSIDSNRIAAQTGDTISLTFTPKSGVLEAFVKEGVEKNEPFYIWYDHNGGRDKVALTLDTQSTEGYTFTFDAPDTNLSVIDFAFYNEVRKGYETFGYADFIENVVDYPDANGSEVSTESLTQEERDSYEQCIADGGTEIGCRVGSYIVGSMQLQGYASYGVAVQDNYLFVADYNSGLQIIDMHDPAKMNIIGSVILSGGYAYDVVVNGNYAYVADSYGGLYVVDISAPSNPVVAGSLSIGNVMSIYYDNNYIYAANMDAGDDGFMVIDVSDPAHPTKISSLYISQSSMPSDIVKNGNYIYLAVRNAIKVIDVSDPSSPQTVTSIDTVSAMSIDLSGNYLYAIDRSSKMHIFDISDPLNPAELSSIDGINYISVTADGNYAYVAAAANGIEVIDVQDPMNPRKMGGVPTGYAYKIVTVGSYGYVADGSYGVKIIDFSSKKSYIEQVSDLSQHISKILKIDSQYVYAYESSSLKVYQYDNGDLHTMRMINSMSVVSYMNDSHFYGNTLFVSYYDTNTSRSKITAYDLSDPYNMKRVEFPESSSAVMGFNIIDHFLYCSTKENTLEIYDLQNINDIQLKKSISVENYGYVFVVTDNYIWIGDGGGASVYDIRDRLNPQYIKKIVDFPESRIIIRDDYLYTTRAVYDISDPINPEKIGILPIVGGYSMEGIDLVGNYLVDSGNIGMVVFDISRPESPSVVALEETTLHAYWIDENTLFDGRYIYDFNAMLLKYTYYHPITHIALIDESYKDYSVVQSSFTKEWVFSEDISSFDISIVSNSYGNYISDIDESFKKEGNRLKITLSPDTTEVINKLVLKFTKDGNPVKINGSETFWSLTKTNHAPRLADGQVTQLVGSANEPAKLTVEAYDADGDTVSLSVVDDAGGYVGFSQEDPNRLFASFNDGKAAHTITVALDDGKERVLRNFEVLQFDASSIEEFYSDARSGEGYPFEGIAFGTLKGVVSGQPDPNDPSKRIFRPEDNASMAEALAMVVNAQKRAGFVSLENADEYMTVYPAWAMPYYTFARSLDAIDPRSDLASYYPSREEIAKLIVKSLKLDEKIEGVELTQGFSDDADFSDEDMLRYAKTARFFGLFMNDTAAHPQEKITRAELATVIAKIFMIPHATIRTATDNVVYGKTVEMNVESIDAERIDTNYALIDNASEVTVRYVYKNRFVSTPLDTKLIDPATTSLKALLDNNGVKNIVEIPLRWQVDDRDNDGMIDALDAWDEDARYYADENRNGIPDILDEKYALYSYNADSVVNFDGQLVSVSELILNGGYTPDLDGDGIEDDRDSDMDGDGVVNEQDAFPRDKNESVDTDGDGVGDNADSDDDNDGISDSDEEKYGLDPKNPDDADADYDGDGISNIDEVKSGTDPNGDAPVSMKLSPISDLYVEAGGLLPMIEIEIETNSTLPIYYGVSSDNTNLLTVLIEDKHIVFDWVNKDAEGIANITIIAKQGLTQEEYTFCITVAKTKIFKEEPYQEDHIEYESFLIEYNRSMVEVTKQDNGGIFYLVRESDAQSRVSISVAGTKAYIDLVYDALIQIPFENYTAVEISHKGEVKLISEDLILPDEFLPINTKVDINESNIKIIAPLPNILRFRSVK